jgi:hypothetical protein
MTDTANTASSWSGSAQTGMRMAGAVALVASCGPGVSARQCETGFLESAVVRSQADIDALRAVDEIEELRIEASDLRSLRGLECITRLGNLYIEANEQLESLRGLDGLVETVGPHHLLGQGSAGEFFIRGNPALTEISGFDSLTVVDGSLEISDNSSLVDIRGFENVHLVRSRLAVTDNPKLESVAGFGSFEGGNVLAEGEGGLLTIERNARLESVTLGDGVTPAALAGLEVRENPELSSLDVRILCTPESFAFESNPNLRRLPESVMLSVAESGSDLCFYTRASYYYRIRAMPGLVDLAGLPHIEGASVVEVIGNTALRSLVGLDDLVGASELTVVENPTLESLAALDPTSGGSLENVNAITVQENSALDPCQLNRLVDQLLVANPELEVNTGNNGEKCQ